MKIAVAKEIDPSEPRVAASPDTVKKFKALGVESCGRAGRWVKSGLPDSEFTAAGATVSADALQGRRHRHQGEAAGSLRAFRLQARRAGRRHHGSVRQRRRAEGDGGCGRFRLCDGIDAAYHPRPGDGRAVVAGEPRRLPCGDRGRRSLWPRLPDDDDGCRHRAGGESVRDGRRRRRPSGDRDRAASRRRRYRDRRAPGHEGAGRKPRC